MKYIVSFLLTAILFIPFHSCRNDQESNAPAGPGGWLKGSNAEKFETIAGHLRGFDVTMVEVGYRYQELYWAGKDENWEYANYQAEKIEVALENGFARRPLREKSGTHFLNTVLPEMKKTIQSRDTAQFSKNFLTLTTNCNACHTMEKVPFFFVSIPIARQSPIRK
jgi:hypothetical protein